MRWEELTSLPVIERGQDADLRIKDTHLKVWTSRLTEADGQADHTVIVECLDDATGRWVEVGVFQAE